MNLNEKKMVSLLTELREKYNVAGVKAEFEAEGTRLEEAMRLKEISMKAGLGLTIKIGGCEAIKDMFESASLGVCHMVGPMVETPYALKKYLGAVKLAFNEEQRQDIEFLINVETITACKNFDDMLKIPEINQLQGIVIGRVDLTGSMGLNREHVNGDEILKLSLDVAAKAKSKGLKVVVGGAVSVHSLPFFRAFPKGHIDRFETRKVVFQCPGALENSEAAFLKAVEFEILWLKNKKAYYGSIHREDDSRLVMMEERYKKSIEALEAKR
ncbi:MAG: aldolase [Bdellovibrionales bacterium]|nr:aldolase [Bdellovibrionales bacterium]